MNEDLDEFSDIGEQIESQPIKFTENKFDDDITEEIEESQLRPQELKFEDQKVEISEDNWEDEEIAQKPI